MIELLISTLEGLGYQVMRQGSLLPSEPYPESFFTFWNPQADGTSFYDDDEHAIVWTYEVNFYSVDPTLVNTMLLTAKASLKEAGFIATGAGYDVASDEITHTGRGITVYYREKFLT